MVLVDKRDGYYGSYLSNIDNLIKIDCMQSDHNYKFDLEIYIENDREEMIRLYNRIYSDDEYPALIEELYPEGSYKVSIIHNLELLILNHVLSITGISYDRFRGYSKPISFIKNEIINSEYWFRISNDELNKNHFFWSIDPEKDNDWKIYDLSIKRVEINDSEKNNRFIVKIYLIPLFKHERR